MKCIYKHSETCCSTIAGHHLQIVNDNVCDKCKCQQEKPTVGEKQQVQNCINKALEHISEKQYKKAVGLLNHALKI